MPYPNNRHILDDLLFHLCYPLVLAVSGAVPSLYISFLYGSHIGELERQVQFPALTPNLVNLCIVFPCALASLRTSPANSKVHFRISPTWNHLAWRIRGFLDGGSWVFQVVSRNNKYAAHPRFEFQNPVLQGICAGHGRRERISRIVRESAHEGW